jgi:hypothetical protein
MELYLDAGSMFYDLYDDGTVIKREAETPGKPVHPFVSLCEIWKTEKQVEIDEKKFHTRCSLYFFSDIFLYTCVHESILFLYWLFINYYTK